MPVMRNKQLTIRLLHRTVRFLFSVLIALLALFVLGNLQNFLDTSQIMILKFLSASSVLLFICAFFTFLCEVYYTVYNRTLFYLRHCVSSIIAAAFGLVTAIAASAVLLLSSGFHQ